MLSFSITDRNALLDTIFYTLYKPLYSDLERFLRSNVNLTELVHTGDFTSVPWRAKVKSKDFQVDRVRFLGDYFAEMEQRNIPELADNLKLMISAMLVAGGRGEEFLHMFEHECLESTWQRNTSVLAKANALYTKVVMKYVIKDRTVCVFNSLSCCSSWLNTAWIWQIFQWSH